MIENFCPLNVPLRCTRWSKIHKFSIKTDPFHQTPSEQLQSPAWLNAKKFVPWVSFIPCNRFYSFLPPSHESMGVCCQKKGGWHEQKKKTILNVSMVADRRTSSTRPIHKIFCLCCQHQGWKFEFDAWKTKLSFFVVLWKRPGVQRYDRNRQYFLVK